MTQTGIDLTGLGRAEACRRISRLFADRKLESAEADARTLMLGVMGLARADLVLAPDQAIPPDAARKLADCVLRRLAGEPVTRILGTRAFWTLDLKVTPDVLDPRPDSETIIMAALEALGARKDSALRLLDLGTGSGALLLALLSECPNATGLGVDLSERACAVAQENARRNQLANRTSILQGRWMDGLTDRFDVILSNPPYIESGAIPELAIEVRQHDPSLALDGGDDGLSAYRDIMPGLPAKLQPDGVVVLELGQGQAPAVARLAQASGLQVRDMKADLGGVIRALVLEMKTRA